MSLGEAGARFAVSAAAFVLPQAHHAVEEIRFSPREPRLVPQGVGEWRHRFLGDFEERERNSPQRGRPLSVGCLLLAGGAASAR